MAPSLNSTAKVMGLAILSIICLPGSVFTVFLIMIKTSFSSTHCRRSGLDISKRRTILVTGLGMAKGLALARAFFIAGHRVIGADFETSGIPCAGRYSKSLSAFYKLQRPTPQAGAQQYIRNLTEIVQREGVDLWVSCSGVTSAMEDAQAKESLEKTTRCTCIQFDIRMTSTLHNKDLFIHETKSLGLPVPETHKITSREDIIRLLYHTGDLDPSKKFILKCVGIDDVNRNNITLIPQESRSDTEAYISRLAISSSNPWIMQRFIPGGEEYCTHALVVRGQIKCFVACPSSDLLMHYQPLPPTAGLSRAMLAFTQEFVTRSNDPASMTGHLSFDFMVQDGNSTESGTERRILAIECNPRAHTAVVLYSQPGPELESMVRAYLSAVSGFGGQKNTCCSLLQNGTVGDPVSPPPGAKPRYWLAHDVVSLVFSSGIAFVLGQLTLEKFFDGYLTLMSHLFLWKEGTFEPWDPLPALALYHVFWPLHLLSSWWQGRNWSRVNVSTTKMFAC